MSSGCSLAKSVEVVSIPSINISGDLAYPKVLTPRIKNSALSLPGSPLLWYEITPATLPAREVVKLLVGIRNSSGLIEVTAAITLDFFCLP